MAVASEADGLGPLHPSFPHQPASQFMECLLISSSLEVLQSEWVLKTLSSGSCKGQAGHRCRGSAECGAQGTWQQSLPLDPSPNLPCSLLRSLDQAGSQEHTISLVLEDRVALPFKLFRAARNSLHPGPARGDCPILHYSFSALWPFRFLYLGPWSQLLPSPAPQPVLSCGPDRGLGNEVVGRAPSLLCAWPMLALPVLHWVLPSSLLGSVPSPGPPKPIWRPQGPHCQQFSRSLSPGQIVWELCQFLKKICFVNRGRSLFYISVNHFIHIRGLCVLPSFPTTPAPQAHASPGTLRRQEQRKEQVVNEHPKYEGKCKINVLLKGSVFWKVEVLY